MSDITIVICYVRGTAEMMAVCLGAIARHTDNSVRVIVATGEGHIDDGLVDVVGDSPLSITILEVMDRFMVKGREHGAILDRIVMNEVSTPYTLTLDSDCFPIADGWLEGLQEMMRTTSKSGTAGILHPWGPPPQMKTTAIEWRVRKQHCWETTHVACQLIRTVDAKASIQSAVGYAVGDDTSLGMIELLKSLNHTCTGYKPTRCPKPAVEFDAEFNRYSCVVYGDMVVHVGGFSRENVFGDDAVFGKAFNWVEGRILEEGGAEFLLEDDESYRYTLDREEEVAAEKMQRLFGLKSQRMTV